jgi:CubicO group peptidase (beta-lactamase class C family)
MDARRSAGWSKARLARMGEVLAGHVAGGVPGLVAMVDRHGETHVEAHGATAVTGGVAMRPDTIVRISSMTKPVTAVATLILLEECRLRLDDPVDDLLPELADRRVLRRLDGPVEDTVPAARSITVRDLLTFRLGYGMLMGSPAEYPILAAAAELGFVQGPPSPGNEVEPDEWLRRFATLPLMEQPGERWRYNTGSEILGILVARAAGRPFEEFLRERILDPLGMVDTGFSVPAEKMDRFATAYVTDPHSGGLLVYDEPGGQWSRPPAFPNGAGGLVSTAADYLAFGRMLLHGGELDGERILSRQFVEAMTTDQLTAAQKREAAFVPGQFDNLGYGYGVAVVTRRVDPAGTLGAYGWDGGLGTCWTNDPAEGLVAVLMTQRAWTSPAAPAVARDFRTLTYQAIEA